MRRRDVLASDLVRAGVLLRFRPVRPEAGWMFEGLAAVALRALGVAVMRRSRPARRFNRVEV